jgi:hypothetical protein
MIEENLALPFATTVLGVEVTVRSIDLTHDGAIVALCSRGSVRQKIGILELPMPTPAPDSSRWVEAYRHWVGWR